MRVTFPSLLAVVMSVALALVAGCEGQITEAAAPLGSGGSGWVGNSGSGGAVGSGGALGSGGSVGSGGSGQPGGPVVSSDLPCDVADMLAHGCISCHGTKPASGAPMSLVSYADLTAPAISDPTKTFAVVAVARMMNTASPMPPAGLPLATAAEIASLQNWISAGYPRTGCASVTGPSPDAGAPPDPFAVAPTCTSGTNWTRGTSGSASMEPGQACINCHASSGGEAPRFTIAGTLYPTAHEPDLCNGANGSTDGAKVVITGADGTAISISVNSAGNFSYSGTVATPFHAKVTYMGRERPMAAGQTSGDCNSCHTQNGTMAAPGRIILP